MILSKLCENIIRLKLIKGFGNKTILFLINHTPELENTDLSINLIKPFIKSKQIENFIIQFPHINKRFEAVVQLIDTKKIKVVTIKDSIYPKSLISTYNPPPILFYFGDITYDFDKSIAVVGTRSYTSYGQSQCKKFIDTFAEYNITIVSGLAAGIDALSHTYALTHELKCIGVVGHGLQYTYPVSNYKLFAKVLEKNGCVISDFLPDEEPRPENFPLRNRIIATLARSTLVIEAAQKSGSLITARCAFEESRDVFALPADLHREQSQGCNEIIKLQIAKLVTGPEDILEEYNLVNFNTKLSKPSLETHEYSYIIKLLEKESLTTEEIVDALKADICELNSILTELELEGVIQKDFSLRWGLR